MTVRAFLKNYSDELFIRTKSSVEHFILNHDIKKFMNKLDEQSNSSWTREKIHEVHEPEKK